MRQVLVLAAAVTVAAGAAACGASSSSTTTRSAAARPPAGSKSAAPAPTRAPKPKRPPPPRLLPSAQGATTSGFVPAVTWRGQTAVWLARTPAGVALLSFNQRLAALRLHSGTIDAGGSGWRWGPDVAHSERAHVIAAFNGGFRLNTGSGGFMSYGRTASGLRSGLGSIVTYADGYTDVGSWHGEVPQPGRAVVSVRQNLTLLIDHGKAAATVDCLSCWGATLRGVSTPARSALGVTADGRLIWAGGEHLTVADLASAMLAARVVRAVELDINPEWVAAYLYGHHGRARTPVAVPIVPGQPGIPGQFLTPYSRDFFTIVARG